ncbi:HpcH/HpaI aldolase/citrate lyase family protein [Actinomadura sp. 9N215]|uniref:HpcH/HpaI aldolase/citrate lyase family protein n=1 Tax=Actinomadura sp. 9N215 TaxID=3375150 RepID=UPI0037BE87F0
MMKFSPDNRSMLFTPATSAEKFASAHRSGADVAVVDLEDAVAEAYKDSARKECRRFFTGRGAERGQAEALRINPLTTVHGLLDLLALCEFDPKPDVIVVPKVEAPRDIEIVESILSSVSYAPDLAAILETPKGLERASDIAQSSPRMRALVFGSADYSFAIGASRDWASLYAARARIVNTAYCAGIDCVDAPVFDYHDVETLAHESVLDRNMGFSGKAAIHPSQVPLINERFSPDPETIELARQIVAASEANSGNATSVGGMMIGRPFVSAAMALLRRYGSEPAEPMDTPEAIRADAQPTGK